MKRAAYNPPALSLLFRREQRGTDLLRRSKPDCGKA